MPTVHGARSLVDCAVDRDWAQATLAAVSAVSRTGEAIAFEHSDGMGQVCVETRLVKSGDDEAVCIARDITARKQAERRLVESLDRLNKTQRQLMEASRLAGMAEVASSVLHNVGNVLNSVNVSATTATEILAASPLEGLGKAVRMLGEHRSNLDSFLSEDPKGKRLLPFLEQLTKILLGERERMRLELESLQKNVDHIKMIVTTQQSNARSRGFTERLAPSELVEDAIKLSGAWDGRDDVQLVRDYRAVPEADVDRHKLLQILINLLTNARHAVASVAEKTVVVRVASSTNQRFTIEVEDSGCGIPSENLTKIFNHGFTTRKDGHGFGLHGSALAAGEMGGTLTAASAGVGRGARFAVELPLSPLPEGVPR